MRYDSLQEEGGRWSKKSTFCKLLYHRKCKRREVGGQKKTNLVNVVCKRTPRAEVQKYFRWFFGSNENFHICIRD